MGLLSTIGAASGRAFGLTRVGAVIRDAYFNLTTLLLPGNGTNGAQNNTFLDSSTNNFTITRNGNTTQGSFSPFSQTGWGVFLDNSGDYFTADASTLGGASVSTFTIDGWIFPTTFANIIYVIGDMQPTGGTNFLSVNIETSGAITLYWFDGATKTCTSTGTLTLNQWNYFAIRVSSNAITIYANSATAGQTGTTTLTSRTGTSNFAIGAFNGSATPNAYLSNLRVSTVARTISIPTSAFSNDADTRFLLFQSNRFINNGSTSATLTPFGNTSVQAFSPFAPTAAYDAATVGGSGYFDGSGDYLSFASNAAFTVGTGNLTIEAWIYVTSLSQTYQGIASGRADTPSNFPGLGLTIDNSQLFFTILNSGSGLRDSANVPLNQWVHVVGVRSGTNAALFVNGARKASSTNSENGTSSDMVIGRYYVGTNNYYFSGYIAGARLLKGTAAYDPTQTSITVPTAPFTNVTNTSFLTNFTNAGITDATAKNDLETVGNAQISTTQSKFGGGSMYFDGTGDYLSYTAGSPAFNLSTSDWTIEAWVYRNVSGVAHQIISLFNSAGSNSGLSIKINSSNLVQVDNGVTGTTAAGTVSANTWVHIAVVRSSGNTQIYVNGTAAGSAITQAPNTAQFFRIGITALDQDPMNGYIDDLRITRYARYTNNFTAPTAALPLQ